MVEELRGFWDSFEKRYGQYAFGILGLLLIWFVIVKPELQASRLDFSSMHGIVAKLEAIADDLESTSRQLD